MTRETRIEELFASTQNMFRGWKAYFFRELGPENISPAQMGLLFHLHTHGNASGRSISAAIGLSPSALSQILESLDSLGFITRQPDPADRRVIYFGLSPAGARKVTSLNDTRRAIFAQITQTLTDDEIEAMIHIQQKLIRQIEAHK